jgi:hypothetical protein
VTIHGKEYLYGAVAHNKDIGKYKIEFKHSHLKSWSTMDAERKILSMNLATQLRNDCMVQDNIFEAHAERNEYEKFIHAHDKSDNTEYALDSDEEGGDEDEDKVPDGESLAGYHSVPHQTPFRFDPLANSMTPDYAMPGSEEKSTFITLQRDIKLPANPKKKL